MNDHRRSSSLATPTEPRAGGAARRSSGAPIRVGLVGLGNVGLGHHVPAYLRRSSRARVVAVADPSAERRALAVAALGLDTDAACATAEELIARPEVDVVDLATAPDVRARLALAAIAAGKAVLCEKPLATVPADAAAIVRAAAAAGVAVGMVHNYLALPEIVVARAVIADGAIGTPEVAVLSYLGVEDRPGSVGWRPGWRHDPALSGGGVLMDMLHVVYVAEALVGQQFRRVSCELIGRAERAPVEDLALCRFDADRAVGLINVGWGVGPGGIGVAGPEGRIEVAYENGGTSPFAPLATVRLVRRDGSVRDLTPPPAPDPTVIDVRIAETFDAFFDALVAGDRPPATAPDGLRTLEATLGAYASAVSGRPVALPLSEDHPVYVAGLAGLADLALDPGGHIGRHGMFGIGPVAVEEAVR